MRIAATAALAVAITVAGAATPASAQLFWQPPDFHGAPIAPGEVGIGQAMPGATADEERAHITWQMRAGLNVMALQCQFDRTLMAQNTYNGILTNHKDELAKAYATLTKYFARVNKLPKAGRNALDQYGTKTYLAFSTVRAQFTFCQTAAGIARSALTAPRGSFGAVAVERLRELRGSLTPAGEQLFRFPKYNFQTPVPDLGKKCWDGRNRYRRCAWIG